MRYEYDKNWSRYISCDKTDCRINICSAIRSQSYFDLFGSVEFADDPVEDLENEVQIWRSVARNRENPRQERKKLEAALERTRRQLDCFESGGDKLQENLLH